MIVATVVNFSVIEDERGALVALESGNDVPFEIKRIYYIYGTDVDVSRGFHAHKELRQLAVCVAGNCKMQLDDGNNKTTVLLDSPSKGVLIESMIWHEMHDFSRDCILLVIASEHYDESDYIRDYELFLKEVAQ